MNMVLEISASAEKKSFATLGTTGVLSIVGLVTTETVAIEIPRVDSPNVSTDAHWTALMQDDAAVTLRAGHNVVRIPGKLLVRLNKDAGVSSNAYGVAWE